MSIDLLELRAAIPNLPDAHRSIQFHPIRGSRKWMQETPDMGVPNSEVEIEIVLPVRQFSGRFLLRRVYSLGDSAQRKEARGEQAWKNNPSDLPKRV